MYTLCIVGILGNLIIIAANFRKWKTLNSFLIGDKILSSLATSRSLHICVIYVGYISPLYNTWVSKDLYAMSSILVLTTFLHSTNLWFATVLCVFYCVKITSYSWKFFIFLKTKISTLVPWFLLTSLLMSVLFSLPLGWIFKKIEIQHLTNASSEDFPLTKSVKYEKSRNMLLLFLTGSGPPFLLFVAAITLLLHSLWMHIRRMRSSGSGVECPNLEIHFSAVKSMSLFLVLQTMYLLSKTMYFAGTVEERTYEFWITAILTCSPPTVHSLYIISSNRDLRNSCISMFHVFTCSAQG
ncbi:hypothetical protein GDO81_028881 [Engystomops pustulosus]|uniref:Taste receptor type 2 n=1 Tax=Engystomops pustulosus TaxID=76066 RepID=A0AAV6ZU20_ENGPU|nr:hypothetical protein GDO81_028881 [Engystomops pustulosus]